MKKRLFAVLLSLCMAMCLLQVSAGASVANAKTISVNELPEKKQLEDLLTWIEFYIEVDSFRDRKYDFRENTVQTNSATGESTNLFALLISYPNYQAWMDYPGENYTPDDADNYSYYAKTSKTKIDWIMTNIFNCNSSDLEQLKNKCLNVWNPYEDGVEYLWAEISFQILI